MKKKVVSLLLAILMVLMTVTILSVTTFAAMNFYECTPTINSLTPSAVAAGEKVTLNFTLTGDVSAMVGHGTDVTFSFDNNEISDISVTIAESDISGGAIQKTVQFTVPADATPGEHSLGVSVSGFSWGTGSSHFTLEGDSDTETFTVTAAPAGCVIPVSAKLAENSPTPAAPVDCTFTLMPLKKVIGGVESTDAIPMPASATLTLTGVGKNQVDGSFTIPMDGCDVGTYYYTVKQTTAANDYTFDSGVWTITIEVTATGAEITKVVCAEEIQDAQNPNKFTIKKNEGTEASATLDDGKVKLTLGGNQIGNKFDDVFNTAVIRSDFAVDFTRDFKISGKIIAASVPDGSFIGFVPGAAMPETLREGGSLAVYAYDCFAEGDYFGNSILFEFDAYLNGDEEYAGDSIYDYWEDEYIGYSENDVPTGKHFALMKINEYGEGKIVNKQYHNFSVDTDDFSEWEEGGEAAWNTPLPYTITLDTKGTTSTGDDVLTFNVDNGKYNWSYTNPIGHFGQETAYFLLGGVLRYGPAERYGLGETGELAPATSISFEEFDYTRDASSVLFINSYCPHTHDMGTPDDTTDDIVFEAWSETTQLPTEAGNYVLTEDVTLDATWIVPTGTVNLCLNGHVIKLTDGNTGSVIYVPVGATLNLYDCGTTEHYFTVNDNGLWTLTDTQTDTTKTVKGGIITGGTGTKFNETQIAGGGLFIDGKATMNGGNIVGNYAKDSGGGVYVFEENASFTMTGGTISGNYAGYDGGGVSINLLGGSTFTMTGGEITNNTAAYGGGIQSNGNGSILNLTAAAGKTITITGNTATASEGGVTNWGEMHLSGKVIIKDNICNNKYGDVNYPLNLATWNPIIIDGALTDSEIHITHIYDGSEDNYEGDWDGHYPGVLTSGFTTKNTGAELGDFFTYDGPADYTMVLNTNGDNKGELEVVNVYAITNGATVNDAEKNYGYLTVDKAQAVPGDTVTITVTPYSGYSLKTGSLKAYKAGDTNTPVTLTPGQNGTYTFEMPDYPVTVTAEFEEDLAFCKDADGKYFRFEKNGDQTIIVFTIQNTQKGLYYALDYKATENDAWIEGVPTPGEDGFTELSAPYLGASAFYHLRAVEGVTAGNHKPLYIANVISYYPWDTKVEVVLAINPAFSESELKDILAKTIVVSAQCGDKNHFYSSQTCTVSEVLAGGQSLILDMKEFLDGKRGSVSLILTVDGEPCSLPVEIAVDTTAEKNDDGVLTYEITDPSQMLPISHSWRFADAESRDPEVITMFSIYENQPDWMLVEPFRPVNGQGIRVNEGVVRWIPHPYEWEGVYDETFYYLILTVTAPDGAEKELKANFHVVYPDGTELPIVAYVGEQGFTSLELAWQDGLDGQGLEGAERIIRVVGDVQTEANIIQSDPDTGSDIILDDGAVFDPSRQFNVPEDEKPIYNEDGKLIGYIWEESGGIDVVPPEFVEPDPVFPTYPLVGESTFDPVCANPVPGDTTIAAMGICQKACIATVYSLGEDKAAINGNTGIAYDTLEAAIIAATKGDTIYCIASSEDITLPKDVTLVADSNYKGKVSAPEGMVLITKTVSNGTEYIAGYTVTNVTVKDDAETNHGYIAIDKTSAAEGETVTVTVVPNNGYQLKSLTITPAFTIKTVADVLATVGGLPEGTCESLKFTAPSNAWVMVEGNCCAFVCEVSRDYKLILKGVREVSVELTAEVTKEGDCYVAVNSSGTFTFKMKDGRLTAFDFKSSLQSSTFNGTYAPAAGSPENLEVTLTKQTDGTYTFTMPDYPVTITAEFVMPVEAPTAAGSLVYDGTEKTGVAEATGYTVANGKATNAGDYTAIVTLSDGFIWSDGTTAAKEISWSIAPADMSIVPTSYENFYDGESHLPAYVIINAAEAVIQPDTVFIRVKGTSEWIPAAEFAPYKDCSNLTLEIKAEKANFADATCEVAILIKPRPVTIIAGGDEKVYDGSPLTCTTFTVKADTTTQGYGFVGGEGIQSVTMAPESTITDVGSIVNVIATMTPKEGTNLNNYIISTEPGTLKVTPAAMSVVPTAYEGFYDGDYHLPTWVVLNASEAVIQPDTVFIRVKGTSEWIPAAEFAPYKDCSNLTLEIKAEKANFADATCEVAILIKPRPVTIIAGGDEKVYDGSPLTCTTFTVKEDTTTQGYGFVDGEGIQSVTMTNESTITNVGSVANVIATETPKEGTNLNNYIISTEPGTLKVSVAKIDKPTENTNTFTYTGEEQTYTPVGFDSNTMEISGNKQTNANETGYTVTVTPKDNYAWSTDGDCTFTWKIEKATPYIKTLPAPTDITYGQKLNDSTLSGWYAQISTTNNAEVGGLFEWKLGNTVPAVSDSESTEYEVTFTPADTDNYNTATCKVTLTVNKAPVAAPANAGSKVYTGNTLIADMDDEDTPYTVMTNDGGTAIGNYDVVLVLNDPDNYKWSDSDEETTTLTFTITKATGTISVDTTTITKTYGESITLPTATSNFGEVICDTLVTDLVNPNTYTVTYTLEGTENYTGDEKTLTVVINKASLKVTIADKTSVYGADIVELTATCQGLVYDDEASDLFRLVTDATKSSNAGEYLIWAEETNGNVNYEIEYIGTYIQDDINTGCSTYTITQKDITGAEVVYDESKTYNGQEQTFSVTSVTIDGLTATFDVSGNKATDYKDGGYTLTITGNGNYTGTVTKSFAIAKKAATITVDAGTKVYGENDPALTATVSGTVGSDALNYTVKRATGENVSEYALSIELGENPNYEIGKVETAKFTITKKAVEKPAADTTNFVYNGSEQTYTIAANALYTVSGNVKKDVGEYNVTVSLNDPLNYEWANGDSENLTHTFTIAKAQNAIHDLTIGNWKDNETANSPSATADFGSDTIEYAYSKADVKNFVSELPTEAGDYIVKASVPGTEDYEAAEAEITFTIYESQMNGGDLGEGETKPAIRIETENGFDPNVELEVEIVVKSDAVLIEDHEAIVEYGEITERFEKIAGVYDVRLLLNGEEIQPKDLGEGTVITVRMLIPEHLIGRVFRIFHVHSEDDVMQILPGDEAGIGVYVIDEDGYLVTKIDKLSEFVFTYQPDCATHWIMIGILALYAAAFAVFTFVMKKKLFVFIASGVCGAAAIALAFFSGCAICTVFTVVDLAVIAAGALYTCFAKKS